MKMQEHPNALLVRQAWLAVAHSDVEALQEFWADDIVWHATARPHGLTLSSTLAAPAPQSCGASSRSQLFTEHATASNRHATPLAAAL